MPLKRALAASLASVVPIALLLTGAAAPAAAATAPPSVVTPAQALAIVKTFQAANNKAFDHNDQALLAKVEGGSARDIDAADLRISAKLGFHFDGDDITALGTKVYVPRQTHYPAVFLAVFRPKFGTDKPERYTSATLFQKAGRTSAWKVTDQPAIATGTVAFSVDKAGYIPTLVPSTLAVSPTAFSPAVLKGLNRAGSGRAPSAAWAFNSTWRNYLFVPKADRADVHWAYTSSHHAPVCLAAKAGGLCFASATMVRSYKLTSTELSTGVRWVVDSANLQFEYGGVAQGDYTTLRTVAQRQVAVLVPRKGSTAKLQLVAETWGPITGKGTLG